MYVAKCSSGFVNKHDRGYGSISSKVKKIFSNFIIIISVVPLLDTSCRDR